MHTYPVYYDNMYEKELDATVIALTPVGFILDKTICYPECGGQSGDRGLANGLAFSDTQKGDEGAIVHIMDSCPFEIGEKVHISLDWPHRYFFMIEHAAQHMVSGTLFFRHGIGTLAVHQGEKILTVETDRMDIPLETLLAVEDEVNRGICENHPITYKSVTHEEAEAMHLRRSIKVEGEVRLVIIEGVDTIACGGLHVASTGEIGEISFAGSEQIRGHVRTIWRVGESAKAKRRLEASIVSEASALLSSPAEELIASIEKLKSEKAELKERERMLESGIASQSYKSIGGSVKAFVSSVPLSYYMDLILPGDTAVIVQEGVDKDFWLIASSSESFARIKKELFSQFGAKGGGRSVYQGMVTKGQGKAFLAVAKEYVS